MALSVLLHCFNAQPYIFAVVNGADVALNVFFSPVSTRCRIFLHLYELLCPSDECFVLLRSPSLKRFCSL